MEKPLLVGELNPYGANPRYALYPLPKGSAGGRLSKVIMGLEPREYLKRFDRVNLCTVRWSNDEAIARADMILASREDGVIVLLGNRVTVAFGLKFDPFTVRRLWTTDPTASIGHKIVVLPHPSGRNRYWNDPLAMRQARRALADAGVELG